MASWFLPRSVIVALLSTFAGCSSSGSTEVEAIVVRGEQLARAMCRCADAACGDGVRAEVQAWQDGAASTTGQPSAAQEARLRAATERAVGCEDAIRATAAQAPAEAPGPGEPALSELLPETEISSYDAATLAPPCDAYVARLRELARCRRMSPEDRERYRTAIAFAVAITQLRSRDAKPAALREHLASCRQLLDGLPPRCP